MLPLVSVPAHSILVHAHRGGRAYRPENTLASFRYGIEVGADVLELDLAVTLDDVLVISHSPYLTAPAEEDAWSENVYAMGLFCRLERPSVP